MKTEDIAAILAALGLGSIGFWFWRRGSQLKAQASSPQVSAKTGQSGMSIAPKTAKMTAEAQRTLELSKMAPKGGFKLTKEAEKALVLSSIKSREMEITEQALAFKPTEHGPKGWLGALVTWGYEIASAQLQWALERKHQSLTHMAYLDSGKAGTDHEETRKYGADSDRCVMLAWAGWIMGTDTLNPAWGVGRNAQTGEVSWGGEYGSNAGEGVLELMLTGTAKARQWAATGYRMLLLNGGEREERSMPRKNVAATLWDIASGTSFDIPKSTNVMISRILSTAKASGFLYPKPPEDVARKGAEGVKAWCKKMARDPDADDASWARKLRLAGKSPFYIETHRWDGPSYAYLDAWGRYCSIARNLVTAAEHWRISSEKDPNDVQEYEWWRRYCETWAVPCATRKRIRTHYRYPRRPDGFEGSTKELLKLVMAKIPVPGTVVDKSIKDLPRIIDHESPQCVCAFWPESTGAFYPDWAIWRTITAASNDRLTANWAEDVAIAQTVVGIGGSVLSFGAGAAGSAVSVANSIAFGAQLAQQVLKMLELKGVNTGPIIDILAVARCIKGISDSEWDDPVGSLRRALDYAKDRLMEKARSKVSEFMSIAEGWGNPLGGNQPWEYKDDLVGAMRTFRGKL